LGRNTYRKIAIATIALISLVGLPDLNSFTQKINSEILISANAAASKVTICHRTRSTTNPYRRITVAKSAVAGAGSTHQRHGTENTPTIPDRIWIDTYENGDTWGDIIPDTAADGSSVRHKLWTTDPNGQNIWNGITTVPSTGRAACRSMTPKEFYDSEIAAGTPAATILADLNEQDANEDIALKAALGGSFTLANIESSASAVIDTTTAATNVEYNSATLNGQIQPGGATVQWRFNYGLSSTLSGSTTLTTLSSNVTTGQSVTANITGLAANTTYFYEVQMVSDPGADTEGIITGGILSFKTDALLTITAQSKSAFVGDATPLWTYTISGLQGSDTITSVTFSYTGISPTSYATNATAPTTASTGSYTIAITAQTFGVGSAANYSITRVNGTYTVNGVGASAQTIDLPAQSDKNYGNAPFLISVTTNNDTGTAIALLVGLESITPATCTLDTNYRTGTTSFDTVTIVSAGVCTIRATQTGGTVGSDTFASATNTGTTRSFTINPAALTITAENKSITVGATSPTWSYTNTSLVYGETIASLIYSFTGTGSTAYGPSTSDPSTSAAATFSITPSSVGLGGSALTSNYTITYVAGTYTINAASSSAAPAPAAGPARDPGPRFRPTPTPPRTNPTQNPTQNPTTPNRRPTAPPAPPTPIVTETLPLLTNDDKKVEVEEVKSNSPVKTKLDEKGEIELIIPTGFKGEIEIEVKEKNGGAAEKVIIPVEGPKPVIEPREPAKELPRLVPEKPGEVNVIGGDKKVTVSWVKDPDAAAYDVYSEDKLVCSTVYSVCTLPSENGVTKKYDVVPVSKNGEAGESISGSGQALASGTLLAIVYFDTDKSTIRRDARETLNKLVNDLFALGLREVALAGHTDTQASARYNDRLSNNRARVVDSFLGRSVIDAYLTKDAFSERSLAVRTRDQVNQQLNRRVEIRVK
jgi:outer membrane protein OmpA-like peptidoglycan-associated protein